MKTTIELAREAGLEISHTPPFFIRAWEEELKAFADLVRADEREQSLRREKLIAERWAIECESQVEIEREACAKVCDIQSLTAAASAKVCAEAIRARSNT